MTNATLTIIILNWNTSELLRQCLESLSKTGADRHKVVVVDNGSTDGSVAMVERLFPQVALLKSPENLGFAGGNNLALAAADTDFVCLLNSDTVVTDGALDRMLEFLEGHPGAVACAPALRLPDGRLQTAGAGYELSLVTAFNYFLFLSKLFPFRCRGFYLDQVPCVKNKQPVEVDWLFGTCLMVKKSAIDACGALDASLFMYAEDAEWCDRLRKAGSLYYLPHLEIVHHHGASSQGLQRISTAWLAATILYFQSKYRRLPTRMFVAIAGFGFLLRMVLYFLLSFKSADCSARCRAMSVYFRFTLKWQLNLV